MHLPGFDIKFNVVVIKTLSTIRIYIHIILYNISFASKFNAQKYNVIHIIYAKYKMFNHQSSRTRSLIYNKLMSWLMNKQIIIYLHIY